jgi:GTP cyclohydrolase IA
MIQYSEPEFRNDCQKLAQTIIARKGQCCYKAIYGIPQGGTLLALEFSHLLKLPLVETKHLDKWPKKQVLIVDDLIDSGATISRFSGYDVATLFIKNHTPEQFKPLFYCHQVSDWITFWWEASEERSIRDNVTRILQFIGEDPTREGLLKTPDRVVRSWNEIYGGYKIDPASVFTVFEPDGYNELVLLKNVEFYSTCEHHLLSFAGQAHIGYIANKKIVGISKLARLLDIYARRLQIQERIGLQVTQALMKYLEPTGAACIIEAEHLCMRCRGVEKQNSVMVTSSLTGVFLDKTQEGIAARAELMSLIKS